MVTSGHLQRPQQSMAHRFMCSLCLNEVQEQPPDVVSDGRTWQGWGQISEKQACGSESIGRGDRAIVQMQMNAEFFSTHTRLLLRFIPQKIKDISYSPGPPRLTDLEYLRRGEIQG